RRAGAPPAESPEAVEEGGAVGGRATGLPAPSGLERNDREEVTTAPSGSCRPPSERATGFRTSAGRFYAAVYPARGSPPPHDHDHASLDRGAEAPHRLLARQVLELRHGRRRNLPQLRRRTQPLPVHVDLDRSAGLRVPPQPRPPQTRNHLVRVRQLRRLDLLERQPILSRLLRHSPSSSAHGRLTRNASPTRRRTPAQHHHKQCNHNTQPKQCTLPSNPLARQQTSPRFSIRAGTLYSIAAERRTSPASPPPPRRFASYASITSRFGMYENR